MLRTAPPRIWPSLWSGLSWTLCLTWPTFVARRCGADVVPAVLSASLYLTSLPYGSGLVLRLQSWRRMARCSLPLPLPHFGLEPLPVHPGMWLFRCVQAPWRPSVDIRGPVLLTAISYRLCGHQAMTASPAWWREFSSVSALRVLAVARLYAGKYLGHADVPAVKPVPDDDEAGAGDKDKLNTRVLPACDSDSEGDSDAEENTYDEGEWDTLGDYPNAAYHALAVGDIVMRTRR